MVGTASHANLKATTLASYEVAAARIASRLGRRKLRALTSLDIEAFCAELAQTGSKAGKPLGPKTIRNTHVAPILLQTLNALGS